MSLLVSMWWLIILVVSLHQLQRQVSTESYFQITGEKEDVCNKRADFKMIPKEVYECDREGSCKYIAYADNGLSLMHEANDLEALEQHWEILYRKIEINECASNPCKNGGTCVDGKFKYSCKCTAGYSGTHCERDIDECASSPCLNGGNCKNHVNSYTCACQNGYVGYQCEFAINSWTWAPCRCIDGYLSEKGAMNSRDTCYSYVYGECTAAMFSNSNMCVCCYAKVVYSTSSVCRLF